MGLALQEVRKVIDYREQQIGPEGGKVRGAWVDVLPVQKEACMYTSRVFSLNNMAMSFVCVEGAGRVPQLAPEPVHQQESHGGGKWVASRSTAHLVE